MKNTKKMTVLLAILMLAATALLAHPHLRKEVSTKLGDVEVKIGYFTAPANMEHVSGVETGSFAPGFGQVEFSADLTVGETTIPAGKYRVGAVRNGEKDWTMGLYAGQIPQGESADVSKVIKLNSMFSSEMGSAAHAYFDILPGHGKLEGKAVLIWHFGPLYLAGALQ